jgi:hypothetical protein
MANHPRAASRLSVVLSIRALVARASRGRTAQTRSESLDTPFEMRVGESAELPRRPDR